MSNKFSKFLKEQTGLKRESIRQKTQRLVEEWEPTRLLEGLDTDDKHQLAQLLQNQAMNLVNESTKTGTAVDSENWEGIALPMVRKIFVEQLAKQLVHTQAMDRPSGYVFYLDFKTEEDRPEASPIYSADESVYGVTDEEADPTGGFYGGTKYSYSMNYQSVDIDSVSVPTEANANEASAQDIGYDPNFVSTDSSGTVTIAPVVKFFEVSKETLEGVNADMLGLETFSVDHANIGDLLRQYTEVKGDNVRFYYVGTDDGADAVADENPVTVHYTVQPTPNTRGDFEMGQEGVGAIPEARLDVTKREINAKTRKLKTVITPEIIQDLDAYHSMDAQKEMADFVTKYVNQEGDTELLNMLSRAARPITRYWSALPGRYLNSKTGEIDSSQPSYTLGPADWYRTLGIRVRDISNELHRRNLRGGANWIVASPKVATILESFNTFATTQENEMTYGMGTKQVGSLDGSIKIYKNPYYKENEMLLGFKGDSFLETGAVSADYVPVQLTPPITDPDTFEVKQGLMTRGAKLVTRSEYYARIIIRDINVV